MENSTKTKFLSLLDNYDEEKKIDKYLKDTIHNLGFKNNIEFYEELVKRFSDFNREQQEKLIFAMAEQCISQTSIYDGREINKNFLLEIMSTIDIKITSDILHKPFKVFTSNYNNTIFGILVKKMSLKDMFFEKDIDNNILKNIVLVILNSAGQENVKILFESTKERSVKEKIFSIIIRMIPISEYLSKELSVIIKAEGLSIDNDHNNSSNLLYLIEKGIIDNVRFLVENGADIEVRNSENITAYELLEYKISEMSNKIKKGS